MASKQDPYQRHKTFYRRLDELLHRLDRESGLEEMLTSFLEEFTDTLFAEELGIRSGRLYRLDGDAYTVVRSFGSRGKEILGLKVSRHYAIIESMREGEVVYFGADDERIDPEIEGNLGVVDFAVFHLGPQRRYIVALGVDPSADHEEVVLVLSTLRHTLTHRINELFLAGQLAEAREIQVSLIPRRPPKFPGFQIAGESIAAEEVGGDVYDLISIDEHLLGVALADASGHGLPAALQARDVVTGLRMGVERDFKITAVIRRLNNVIHRSGLSSRFVSLFYGELEANGTFVYCNAGHEPGFLFDAEGNVEELGSTGIVLGPVPDASYRRNLVRLEKGSSLVLYSDGLVERDGPDGEQWGPAAFIAQLRKGLTSGLDLKAVVKDTLDACFQFGGAKPWADDATLVIVRRRS